MRQYTEIKTIRITKQQKESLKILENYGVDVSQFIRLAVSEKLKRDWKSIKEKKQKSDCPF